MPGKSAEPRFTKFRKWNKFKTLPKLDGFRVRGAYSDDSEERLAQGYRATFDVTDDREQEIARALRDSTLARKIMALLKKFPYGTLPEMVALEYLERAGERFTYQAQVMGGWRQGGLVPDFVVSRGGNALALLINGVYWHNLPGKSEVDATSKLRLVGQYVNGARITDAIIVWESALLSPARERVLDAALQGVELGQSG